MAERSDVEKRESGEGKFAEAMKQLAERVVSLEQKTEEVRQAVTDLELMTEEAPMEKIGDLSLAIRRGQGVIGDAGGSFGKFHEFAEILMEKYLSGEDTDAKEKEIFEGLLKKCEAQIYDFYELCKRKGFGRVTGSGEEMVLETLPEEPKEEAEKTAEEPLTEEKKVAVRGTEEFGDLKTKIGEWADVLDDMSADLDLLQEKANALNLSQERIDFISACKRNVRSLNEKRERISGVVYDFFKKDESMSGVDVAKETTKYETSLGHLREIVKSLKKEITKTEAEMMLKRQTEEEKKRQEAALARQAEEEKRRRISKKLRDIEDKLKKFEPQEPEIKKFRDEIMQQLPELKKQGLDETAVDNLEALVKNRLFAPENKMRADETKTIVRDGLKKHGKRLEKLVDMVGALEGMEPSKAEDLEEARNLYLELDRDWKDINPDNYKEHLAKFRQMESRFESFEKMLGTGLEAEAVNARAKKIIERLREAEKNPDLPKIHLQRVKNLIEDIPTIKTIDQLNKVEEMVRKYISAPLTKKGDIREKTEKAEKKFEEEGKAMGMAEKAAKKGIKEILTEMGVVDIDPKQFFEKIKPEQLTELTAQMKDKNTVEAEKILRDLIREHAPAVAEDYRGAISWEIRNILTAAIEAEAKAELARQQNDIHTKLGRAKQVGMKILGNVGLAAGVGLGVGIVVGSGGVAAAVSGGAIAAIRIANKAFGEKLSEKISESETYKKAKQKATSLWEKTAGRLFKKKAEPPVNEEAVRNQILEKVISKEKLAVLLCNQIREATSAESAEKIKSYQVSREEALRNPLPENIQKFSLAVDDESHNFFRNSLNYVRTVYASENLPEEEMAKMAMMMALTLGTKEKGETEVAKTFKELRAKAKAPEEKNWAIEKFEKFLKLKSGTADSAAEIAVSMTIGASLAYAIRESSDFGRVVAGAIGGAAGGLALERATRKGTAAKVEKLVEKMISDTEDKMANKEMGEITGRDLRKAGEKAAYVKSQLELGNLDNNPLLKNRAESFVFRVNKMQFESFEEKNIFGYDKLLKTVQDNNRRYEKAGESALDKLKYAISKKRQAIYVVGGAVAGGVLGYLGAQLIDYLKTGEPQEIKYTETPEERLAKAPGIAPLEKPPVEPEAEPAVEETAPKRISFQPKGLAELRAHHAPEDFSSLQKQVGHNTAEWVQYLDKNNYHKLSQDLYNAKVNLSEYGAKAAGDAAKLDRMADLTARYDHAEQLLKDHKFAEAGKVLRDISRTTLHERPRIFEAPLPKGKIDTGFFKIEESPSVPMEEPMPAPEEVYPPAPRPGVEHVATAAEPAAAEVPEETAVETAEAAVESGLLHDTTALPVEETRVPMPEATPETNAVPSEEHGETAEHPEPRQHVTEPDEEMEEAEEEPEGKPAEPESEKPKAEEQEPAAEQEETVESSVEQVRKFSELPKAQKDAYTWLDKQAQAHADDNKLQELKKRFWDHMMKGDKKGLKADVKDIEALRHPKRGR